ncbi:porin [Roseateles sp.]|uniref:porin n=1 Tax=Roseateles sp. TaxID=1971397 RepID=UPI003267187C
MNFQLKLLAAAALAGASALAAAQASSVTIFGVLDVGVQRLKNGSKTLNLESIDGLQTSRIGFKGQENLGDGLTASFHLEGAIGPDTGAGGDWRRRATVSLASKDAGEVRLGRDYTPTFWNISKFNAFGTNGVGAASNLVYGFDGVSGTSKTVVRSDNSVGYFLPDGLGGVYGQAMVAAGEGTTGRYVGARVGYAGNGLDLAFAMSETTNTLAGDKFKVMNLGGSYTVGALKLLGLVHNSKQATREQKNYVVGAHYALGSGIIRASFVNAHSRNSANGEDYTGKLFALGYVHNLSKRTSLYTTLSQVNNSKTGRFLIPGGSSIALGDDSRGIEAGIYHSF